MRKNTFLIFGLIFCIILASLVGCKNKISSSDGNDQAITVTDPSGNPVTDSYGFAVTQQVEPVTDNSGQKVTDSQGKEVTQIIVPATEPGGKQATDRGGKNLTEVIIPGTNASGENETQRITNPPTSQRKTQPNPEVPAVSVTETIPANQTGMKFPYTCPDSGLKILSMNKYSGYFIEDGMNYETYDSLAIFIENTTNKYIYYGRIYMKINDKSTAMFDFSYLEPGAKVVVQENTNLLFHATDKIEYSSSTINYKADPEKPWLSAKDIIKIETETAATTNIVVTNISGKAIKEIKVYYRNYIDGVYQGGITYRSTFNSLKPNEEFHTMTFHFTKHSKIIFVEVTYE